MTPDQLTAFNNLPLELKEKFSSQSATAYNRKIKEQYGLTEHEFDTYLEITGDFMFGKIETEELKSVLSSLQKNTEGTSLFDDFIDYLGTDIDLIATKENEIANAVVPDTTPASAAPEREKIEPMRTLESDMQKVHGYGAPQAEAEEEAGVYKSEQSTIFQPKRVAKTPTYNTSTAPPPETEEVDENGNRWVTPTGN